jgi:telomerase reverse transcriptase
MDAAYLCSNTIRLVMGPDVPVLSFVDFIRKYAPDLPKLPPLLGTPDDVRLRHTLFCPSDTLKSVSRCTKVRCPESLDGLVDDVIWTMVQRRGPWNSHQRDTRNVLSNGYVVASDRTRHVQPCPNMRPGVVCIRINSNVSFCKTSSFFKRLYELVGDDVLRMILLHTSVFLPVEDDWENRRGNYLQVCGPTLHPKPIHLPGQILRENTVTHDSEPKRARVHNILAPNAVVSRQSMFYSSAYVPKVGLPDKHELNTASATTLLQSMLYIKSMSDSKKRKCWKGLRRVGVPLCEQIIERHTKCDYARLLNRYCPLPDFATSRRDSENNSNPSPPLSKVSSSHSPAEGVTSFLRAVCRRVFPLEFWGSTHNLDNICELLGSFVHLRRHEQLSNKELMKGLRVTDICWLLGSDEENTAGDRPKKRRTLSRSQHESMAGLSLRVMRWTFCKFVIPLLRSTFYITESEMHAKRVLYYRRPVWSLFRALSVKKLLTRQYQEIDRTEALDRLGQQRMGLSRLRLLPKHSGVRPLVLLSNRPGLLEATESGQNAPPIVAEPSTKPLATNSILRNTFEVLRYENLQQPEARGAGVFGVNEAYPLLRDFLQTVRNESPRRQLYFASVDIEHCYDNINQHRLLDIIKKLLSEDDYLIQNCAVMYPFKSMGRIFKRRLREVGPPEAFRQFHDASHELARERRNSVFLDGVGCTTAKKDQIIELLVEHLTSHLVVLRGRFGDRFFIQSSGIPQGSILSSLLCNFYYGHVEKELLGSDASPTSEGSASDHTHLLLRIVDDFLLISTDRSLSTKFISAMTKGDDRLGVHINNDKILVWNYRFGHAQRSSVMAGMTGMPRS